MTKILMIGLKNGENLGDVIINDCTVYLVRNILEELDYTDYEIISIDMMDGDYSLIENMDLVIFTGGGIIKYKYQKFYRYIDEITNLAQQKGVPVIFNAVGVEGFDENNDNCMRLRHAINRACVKQITTRDDIDLLREKYIYNNICTQKVADSAVWTPEVYGIKKNDNNIIGLGVIREGIFKSNGIDLGLSELLELWSSIIQELELQGEKWQIFTTGWPSDMKFAINLMKYIGREAEIETKVVKRPIKAQELVSTISNYKCIIAGRLHANIISYSLNIPSIGIVWNDKCTFWGNNIGFPARFFKHDNFDGKLIVNECLNAIKVGYHAEHRNSYRMTVYNSLKQYLKRFLNISTNM